MANIWEKTILILAGNLNSGHGYPIKYNCKLDVNKVTTNQIVCNSISIIYSKKGTWIVHEQLHGKLLLWGIHEN